ncbi:hypothetical protein VSDG_04328 [Cytospora chrysosperma]|uniref:Ig-like domain-containing protein n=1 Tax=Cytospora chrysosperma TaxID=252740 RepID=A0A423W5A6_CYTCH|nr:hypothetical protein VSDG_04328 [Valsa sordida]
MKSITLLLAASAGLTTAQLQYNETSSQFTCAEPDQAYCVSDSLQSSIIVRCDDNAIGYPGNCDDNLDGEPPLGLQYSPCWQTSNTTGDAACSKNCVVYGSSGNYNGTFTLPADECTPTYTATLSTVSDVSGASSTCTESETTPAQTPATSSAEAITGSASGIFTVVVGTTTKTTTECPESETAGATSSAGAVTGSVSSVVSVSVLSGATTATIIPPPLLPPPGGANTTAYTAPAGASATSTAGAVTGAPSSTASASSSSAATSGAFATAGAVSNRVGAGLGVVGLLVGALI